MFMELLIRERQSYLSDSTAVRALFTLPMNPHCLVTMITGKYMSTYGDREARLQSFREAKFQGDFWWYHRL